jgi:hypothetical protein
MKYISWKCGWKTEGMGREYKSSILFGKSSK